MKKSFLKFALAALTGAAVLVSCNSEQPVPDVPKAEGAGTVVDVASGPSATSEQTTHTLAASTPVDEATTP